MQLARKVGAVPMIEPERDAVRRDAVQQCHAEEKRPLNASWKRKKLLT